MMAEILTFLALGLFVVSVVVWLPVTIHLGGRHDGEA
jgi:hypothetical protein